MLYLIWEGIVGREHQPRAPPLAEDLLVALGAPDVLRVGLDEVSLDETLRELEQAKVTSAVKSRNLSLNLIPSENCIDNVILRGC